MSRINETMGLIAGEDGKVRCWWHGNLPDYLEYHDKEWGHPVTDDTRLFEKICLEGFQSGLSWLTILRKRENFRAAFEGFRHCRRRQLWRSRYRSALSKDAGIVRHRGKIVSTINNANRALDLQKEFGSLPPISGAMNPMAKSGRQMTDKASIPGLHGSSTKISRDLKKRGWSFVGPTTVYAFMQAMGLVNDHIEGCHCREIVSEKRAALKRPA